LWKGNEKGRELGEGELEEEERRGKREREREREKEREVEESYFILCYMLAR